MNYIDPKPVFLTIDHTDQQASGGTASFNQAGYSFNEAGWTFGGLYGNDGKAPVLKDSYDN